MNGSLGEEELENDEAFSYSSDAIEEEYESEEDDTESSVDLLFRFLHSMFKKVSKRVRKASRSVLPSVIPPQLVKFHHSVYIYLFRYMYKCPAFMHSRIVLSYHGNSLLMITRLVSSANVLM